MSTSGGTKSPQSERLDKKLMEEYTLIGPLRHRFEQMELCGKEWKSGGITANVVS